MERIRPAFQESEIKSFWFPNLHKLEMKWCSQLCLHCKLSRQSNLQILKAQATEAAIEMDYKLAQERDSSVLDENRKERLKGFLAAKLSKKNGKIFSKEEKGGPISVFLASKFVCTPYAY